MNANEVREITKYVESINETLNSIYAEAKRMAKMGSYWCNYRMTSVENETISDVLIEKLIEKGYKVKRNYCYEEVKQEFNSPREVMVHYLSIRWDED